jgi:hypothetical protein
MYFHACETGQSMMLGFFLLIKTSRVFQSWRLHYSLSNCRLEKKLCCCLICYASTGLALTEAGESYKQLADLKYSVEDSVKQNFIEPLQQFQSKEIKEVNVSSEQHSPVKSDTKLDAGHSGTCFCKPVQC